MNTYCNLYQCENDSTGIFYYLFICDKIWTNIHSFFQNHTYIEKMCVVWRLYSPKFANSEEKRWKIVPTNGRNRKKIEILKKRKIFEYIKLWARKSDEKYEDRKTNQLKFYWLKSSVPFDWDSDCYCDNLCACVYIF